MAKRMENGAGGGGGEVPEDDKLPLLPELGDEIPFPVDALPPVLANAVRAISILKQVPISMAAQSVLAVASLACQPLANVRTPSGSAVPLSLYMVTLAPTGARKTASDNDAMKPVRLREDDLRDSYDMERPAHETASAAHEIERKKFLSDKKISKGVRSEKLAELGPAPVPPLSPYLTLADTSFEGLVKSWPTMHASLGLFSSDGGQFLGGWSARGDGQLLAGAGLSTIWDGSVYHRNRADGGLVSLHGRRLAMHLLVQPDAALDFLNNGTFRAQGLMSRILLAFPPNIIGTRKFAPPKKEALLALDTYAQNLHAVLKRPWPLREKKLNELVPRELTTASDADALALWIEFYDEVERQCGKDGKYNDLAGFGEKAAEIVCRIAGIFALIPNPHAQAIDAQVMLSAIRVTEWYLAEAVRVRNWAAAAMIISDTPGRAHAEYRFNQAAQKLLDFARRQAGPSAARWECTRKFLMQKGPAETRQASNLTIAVNCLRHAGHMETPSADDKTSKLVFTLK